MYILRPLILGHTVLLSLFLVSCNARPSYYITAPSYIMPGANTSLAVHWFGNYSEITVTAGFMDKGRILVNASKLFYNDSIGMLTLPGIPAVSASNYYTLGMIGCAYNTLVFSEYIPLYMKTKNISIFIQTEKTMYKPGESVKIRVISVNQDLMPYKGNVNLVIKDPKGNIIQQWLNMKSDLGVVSIEFLLSNSPLLGDWIIQVTSGDYVYSVNFSVAEFASPGFDVTLDVPSFYINSKTDDLIGTVTAKASSVKPIIGSVIISVKPLYDFGVNTEVNKTYQLSSGSVNFSFTYEEIQNELYREAINVTASVTEELTGIVVNASSNVTRAYSEYRINLIRKQLAFAPGLNFTAKFQVQRMDQNPLSKRERDEKVSVTITQVLNGEQTDITMQQIIIPESAILNIEFPVLKSVRWVSMNVVYRNVSEMFYSDDVYTMNPFIEIQIPESSLKVGKPFEVRVNTYLELREIYYMVISKGTVVSVGKNSTTFSLTPEQSWAPSAQLIVYMLSINQTYKGIMQISKTLSIKGIFNNKVSLSWSKNTAQPTEQVSLSVNVKESGSLVGLRVVDKSSTRLGDGNDLTASRVYRELNSYYQGITTSLTDGAIYNKDDLLPRIHNSERIELPSRQVIPVLSENWIWLEINISSSLTRTLQVVVPDRNTSWVATAFVISEGLGLGVIDEPVEISVFKPFLLSFNMPYSVTRGEQFILEVILSSSLAQNLQVLVTLEPSDSFEIIVPNNNNTGTVAGQQNVTVASQGGTTVLYPIKPRKLGNITITVKATSNAASDVLTKTIIVKAEGVKYFYSQTTLFTNANANQTLSKNFSFTFPNDVVQGSEEAFVTVIGDLLGPSINGLESLIQMPYGCGEQNMINLAPNIYILQYLTAVNQLKEDMRKQAINFMEQGYQKELTYKRDDGSFSAFGNSDPSGSTWLSAFVFRCFLQARPFIYINPDVLRVTVEWMVQYQDMNTGVFSEPGCVIHHELQGGLNGPITLTAYILTSLLEDEYYRHLYEPRVVKAVQYLESEFEVGISSNYTLSVVVYALSLANSTKAEVALTQLNSRASITGGTKYWSSSSETSSYYWQPRTTDIETAAYALLSYYKQNRIVEGIPVMKWLSEQRSHLGGYGSTQDTIMALKALSQFMLVAPSSQTSLTVSVTGSSPFVPKTFQINSGNLLVLQSQQIEISQPLLFTATAVGRGLAIFQFNIMYNRKSSPRRRRTTPLSEAFKLDVTVKEDKSNIHKLSVDVCMRYQGMGNESGMALLDVGFLSGFTLKPEGIPKTQSLKLVEPKEDKVYIYLDSLTKDELCVSVPMVRFAKVAGAQDAVVKVCDYYNPEKAATRTYNSLTMSSISSCDFCGVNCNQCKSNVPVKPQKSSATAPTFSILWFSMIFIGYLL